MDGTINRAIGLWESWHRKQEMLESVFGSGIAAELNKEKFEFLSAGVARISPSASPDEKLVLAMLKKTTARLEKQIYPNPVLRVLRRLKSLVYDRPVQTARLRQLKADNIVSLSSELGSIGVNPERLNLEKRLDFENPRLDIAVVSAYGADHNFQMKLHMEKNDSEAYQLNGYTAMLKDPVNPEKSRSYTFDAAGGINAREAAKLLQGRSVLKHYQIGENRMGSKWLQLDFKNLDIDGKPVLKEMGADYEFNISQQVAKIASALEKWELTSARVLDGLEKGNQILLKGVGGETTFLEANAIDKQVVLRNEQGKSVAVESLVSAKKTQMEKPKSLKLTKSRKKEQSQSLVV
ncbi:hypothetical protein SAMN04487898_12288 [Pedobacter sp. ok626]|uniref:hypothetical protein n=1 Tax=Pedobacter sp. ok626 TaxID=1761882 RepID=UPI000887436D|nr:hypothetical protein [Pedobacter sp. ok626]SDL67541.1 hypothetical protein SAMN04487898_12288 [Pedobacter sp. ok626]